MNADERRPEREMPRQEEAGGEGHKERKPETWGPRALGGRMLMAVAGFTLEENLTLLWVQSTTYKENPARSRRSSVIGAETATPKQDWLRGNHISPAAQSVP